MPELGAAAVGARTVSTDLAALLRPADDFERQLYQIEKILDVIEEVLADERRLIRDLAHTALDEDDVEDAAALRKLRPANLAPVLTAAHEFLHVMHYLYTTQREGARAARELLARKERVSTGE